MSSGVNRVKVGAFNGTAAIKDIRTVGFRPKYVRVINVSADTAAGEWFEGFADDSVFKAITDGTMSLATSDGITPLADGFRLGADTDLNVAGEQVYWVAYE